MVSASPLGGSRKRMTADINLAITPMASLFTVILVFLIRSASSSVSTLSVNQQIQLPGANQSSALLEGTKLEVSATAITLEDQLVISLDAFGFDSKELAQDGSFARLNTALLALQQKQVAAKADTKAVIVADINAPYSTLKRVFASAANSGYSDLRLVVVQEE